MNQPGDGKSIQAHHADDKETVTMSNHWGGELLNEALILAETQGFFEGHSSEKIRGLMIKLVELAVKRHDCNAYEILDEIGPRHGLCFCCLNAASKFSPDGYCPTCSAEWEADEDDDEEESSGLVFLPCERSIPFDNLNPRQVEQKAYLQAQLRELQPTAGQFLVAEFSGPRHPKADVETCSSTTSETIASPPPSNTACNLRQFRIPRRPNAFIPITWIVPPSSTAPAVGRG